MNKITRLSDRDRWVSCPVCNKKILKTRVTNSDCVCSCGAEFTAFVAKDFVTTILHEKGENLSMSERLNRYQQQLLALAE